MTMVSPWLSLTLSIFLIAAANLLLKRSTELEGLSQLGVIFSSASCYGFAFLSYFACLHRIPVSVAYPISTGGAILVIVLGAAIAFDETMTGPKALWVALVIVGELLLLK
jgi:multidrug transporter EmrE-like cation transporter